MMLVAAAADELQQLLKARDFDDSIAAKSIEAIFSEAALAQVAADFSVQIVGRNAAVSKWAGANRANDRSVGVLLADRAGNDFLVIHLLFGEKGFRQIRAMEHDAFIGISAEVV